MVILSNIQDLTDNDVLELTKYTNVSNLNKIGPNEYTTCSDTAYFIDSFPEENPYIYLPKDPRDLCLVQFGDIGGNLNVNPVIICYQDRIGKEKYFTLDNVYSIYVFQYNDGVWSSRIIERQIRK